MGSRAKVRTFNVYSTDFRISLSHSGGVKVNRLDKNSKPIGKPVYGTREQVCGPKYYGDVLPGQISAFIRREIFGKKDAPIPEYKDPWDYD